MNIRKTADDYEIITYLEPEVFISLIKQWFVKSLMIKDNHEVASKTIGEMKTPENRGVIKT